MMLLDAGLRIGEIVRLKMDDLHLNEGIIKVLGKGKKERFVPIGSNSQKVLQRYLFRYRLRQNDSQNDHVFLSTCGKPLTENSLKLMFASDSKCYVKSLPDDRAR